MSSGLPGAIAGPGLGPHEAVAAHSTQEEPIHEKAGVESASASTLNGGDESSQGRAGEGVNVRKAEQEFAVSVSLLVLAHDANSGSRDRFGCLIVAKSY